jgi:hypothetical protein
MNDELILTRNKKIVTCFKMVLGLQHFAGGSEKKHETSRETGVWVEKQIQIVSMRSRIAKYFAAKFGSTYFKALSWSSFGTTEEKRD